MPLYLSPKQTEVLEHVPAYRVRRNVCPTCLNTNKYVYNGEELECSDDAFGHPQLRLYKLYLTANIPYQYHTLEWEKYPHKDDKKSIEQYIDNFQSLRFNGTGLSFHGSRGTGKTWAAAHILKNLVRQGFDGWFVDFREIRGWNGSMDQEDIMWNMNRIRECEVLVLDEIVEPFSEGSRGVYEDILENIVRHRTNHNLPILYTTNMSEDDMGKAYPRVNSLLSAKQYVYNIDGQDKRIEAWKDNEELILNGERRPVV